MLSIACAIVHLLGTVFSADYTIYIVRDTGRRLVSKSLPKIELEALNKNLAAQEVVKIYDDIFLTMGCESDEMDTLDLVTRIGTYPKKSFTKVGPAAQYAENGRIEKMLMYASELRKSLPLNRAYEFKYVMRCSEYVMRSTAIMKRYIIESRASDSIVLIAPEKRCINNGVVRMAGDTSHYWCNRVLKINGIPVKNKFTVVSDSQKEVLTSTLLDSLGADHVWFAACIGYVGSMFVYKNGNFSRFDFENANGDIHYSNGAIQFSARGPLDTWYKLLNALGCKNEKVSDPCKE